MDNCTYECSGSLRYDLDTWPLFFLNLFLGQAVGDNSCQYYWYILHSQRRIMSYAPYKLLIKWINCYQNGHIQSIHMSTVKNVTCLTHHRGDYVSPWKTIEGIKIAPDSFHQRGLWIEGILIYTWSVYQLQLYACDWHKC